MSKYTIAAAVGALGILMALGAPAVANDVTFRLHQFLPATAPIPAQAITPWIAKVEKASGGRIKIEHHAAMQLGGKPASLYDQAKDGVVDIVWTVLGYTPGRFPKSEVFELPFMVTTAEATSRAFHEYAMRNAADEFAGIKPIALHTHGPGVLHLQGAGVAKLEDLKGLKIRAPSRLTTSLLNELGATAVGMPVPAVREALTNGTIDGIAVPWEETQPLKLAELVRSHTEFAGERGLYTVTFLFGMNKAAYDRLPADLRKVIDENSGPRVAAAFGRTMDRYDVRGRRRAATAGNTVHVIGLDRIDRWRDAAAPIIDKWTGEMKKKGIDGEKLIDEARRLIAKYSGE